MISRKKKYHHGDLKEQLLEAVRQLIERDGPDGWSIAEACRLAGVSTAAPYKHFKDRDEILVGVVLSGMARMGEAMQAAADAHKPGDPMRIVALGKAYITFARAEPGVFALMFGMAGTHGDTPDVAEQGRGKYDIVLRVVAEHLGRSTDDAEVNARAYALWTAVHGHSFIALFDRASEAGITVPEDAYLAMVGNALLPPVAASRDP